MVRVGYIVSTQAGGRSKRERVLAVGAIALALLVAPLVVVAWTGLGSLVTVTAVDDARAQGNHISIIKHSVSSADARFNGLRPSEVIASIADNDSADV